MVTRIFTGGNTSATCPICPHFERRAEIVPVSDIAKAIRSAKGDIIVESGDFFEHPKWMEILKILKKYDKGEITIQTNATHLFNEEKVQILADVADKVEALIPAHFDFAYAVVMNLQGVFPLYEQGLINLKRYGIPTIAGVPLNGFIVEEPHNFINWTDEVLGRAITGVKIYHYPPDEKLTQMIEKHPRKDITKLAFIYKLVDAELLINLLIERFGKDLAETYNIPACMIRDLERATLYFDLETTYFPICEMCKAKGKMCEGISLRYKKIHGQTREFHPILEDITS